MSTFTKAFIPYNGYYSTPFTRWQGSMANENSIELGAKTARRWFLRKRKSIQGYLIISIMEPQSPRNICSIATTGQQAC